MQRKASDGVPTVEVSLAPPTKPLLGVASEIGSLDAAREKAEAGKMSEVTAAFNRACPSLLCLCKDLSPAVSAPR